MTSSGSPVSYSKSSRAEIRTEGENTGKVRLQEGWDGWVRDDRQVLL